MLEFSDRNFGKARFCRPLFQQKNGGHSYSVDIGTNAPKKIFSCSESIIVTPWVVTLERKKVWSWKKKWVELEELNFGGSLKKGRIWTWRPNRRIWVNFLWNMFRELNLSFRNRFFESFCIFFIIMVSRLLLNSKF